MTPVRAATPWQTLVATPERWQRAMTVAQEAFADGRWNEGIVQLGQAAYLGAICDTPADPHEALKATRAVIGAGFHPNAPEGAE